MEIYEKSAGRRASILGGFPGNSNGGHEVGAGLDADARAALIETIKTL